MTIDYTPYKVYNVYRIKLIHTIPHHTDTGNQTNLRMGVLGGQHNGNSYTTKEQER